MYFHFDSLHSNGLTRALIPNVTSFLLNLFASENKKPTHKFHKANGSFPHPKMPDALLLSSQLGFPHTRVGQLCAP